MHANITVGIHHQFIFYKKMKNLKRIMITEDELNEGLVDEEAIHRY